MQTINFSANEQNLVQTGGGSLFASSTVSYIRALFDLGENWTGWTVRAIWKSRGEQISTVLEDGACMVPAEVLANPGQVYVNLVASETENNVVVERLTTYPVLALVVDARALVDGTETAEITPSQFEQFVHAVEDYSEQAISARDRAETAADNAERDAGIASGAKTDAETAQRKAEDAQGFAEEAATAAGNSAADADRSEGEAAAWATGSYSGGGIPVPASAPQHHNNAKYYSEQAESALNELESASATASTLPAGSGATAAYSDGVFSFGIPKGDKGDTGNTGATGPAAGFGEVSATVDSSVGTPSVEVSASGPDTAKQFAFAFHNLKGEQGEQGDPGEVTNEDLWDILPVETASGAIASFSDGAKNVPLKSLHVGIEPVQDLHGYDNPWPEGGSKNVCFNPTGDFSTSSFPNIYYPSGDGLGIIVNNSLYTAYAKVEKNTNYTFSCFGTPQRHIAYGLDGYPAVDVICHSLTVSGSGSALTFNSGNYEYVAFYYCNDIPNAPTKIQIEKGTSATSYAPYEANICPISGWTGANVTAAGKNLADVTFEQLNANNLMSDGITLNAGTYTLTVFLSGTLDGLYLRAGHNASSDAIAIIYNSNSITFTFTEKRTFYVQALKNTGISLSSVTGCQIELGSATAYEPYTGQTHPISWQDSAGTVYGGYDEVISGEGKNTHAIITLTGDMLTNALSYQRYLIPISNYTSPSPTTVDRIYSNMLKTAAKAFIYQQDFAISGSDENDHSLMVRFDASIDTLEKAKAYVNNNTIQVVYPVTTPSDFSTTPITVKSLYGQNNIWADTGNTSVEYRADIQKYINKVVAALA